MVLNIINMVQNITKKVRDIAVWAIVMWAIGNYSRKPKLLLVYLLVYHQNIIKIKTST